MAGSKNQHIEAENINLRSEDVQEILGKPPGSLIRRGTGVLLLIVVVIITASSLFRYPDIVMAPVVITKENPPSVMVARISGKTEVIFHKDGSMVKKYDTLAVMENPARYDDIFRLRDYIRFINPVILSDTKLSQVSIPGNLVLGDVQPSYNKFASALYGYKLFLNQDLYENRIAALFDELDEYTNYRNNLERQKLLTHKDLLLGLTQFKRDSMLYNSNVISTAEFEKAQTLLLNKQKAYEAASLSLSDAIITIARLERSITDTRLEEEEKQQSLYTSLINSFRQLESSLASWENSCLLIAPASGKLNYLSVWSSLQELKAGDAVFSIIPEDMGELHTWITLPFRGAGKVKPGQRVNIKLDGYPYMEFGMVEGRVRSVSGAPVNNGFPAVISLTNGAVTSYGHELEVQRQLPGTAEISTDEMSLLERLVNPVRHILRNRTLIN
ncbi:MAG: HlyD family secretion protein [bacterium]